MAEFVQQRVEAYVPILGDILTVELMDEIELQFLKQKVTDFEYKTQSQNRTADDVINYAKYMVGVVLDFEERRQAAQNFELKREIEGRIKNKIFSLLGTYTRDFRADLEYWQQSIKVLFKLKARGMLNKHMEQYVKEIGKIHKLPWIQAINYFYNSHKGGPIMGIKIARSYVLRAIRTFPRELQFFLLGVDLELKHEDFLYNLELSKSKAHKNFDFEKERNNCFLLANNLCMSAKESCWMKGCTVDMYKQFFDLLEKYERCGNLKQGLMHDLEANCSSEEETYAVLANLEIKRGCIYEAIKYLEKGLENTPTMKMYDISAIILISLLKDDNSMTRGNVMDDVYNKVRGILRQGHNYVKLSADNYLRWIETISIWHPVPRRPTLQNGVNHSDAEKSNTEIEQILKMALQRYPDNTKLGAVKIKCSSSTSKNLEVLQVTCDEAGLTEMDKLYYDHLVMNEALKNTVPSSSKKPLKTLLRMNGHPYREKILQSYLKSCYLKGFGEFNSRPGVGLEYVREAFETIKGAANYYSLYKLMCKIEMDNINHDEPDPLRRVRMIMETAVLHYGTSKVEFWKDYIDIEKKFNNMKEVTNLHARARRMLSHDLAQIFTHQVM